MEQREGQKNPDVNLVSLHHRRASWPGSARKCIFQSHKNTFTYRGAWENMPFGVRELKPGKSLFRKVGPPTGCVGVGGWYMLDKLLLKSRSFGICRFKMPDKVLQVQGIIPANDELLLNDAVIEATCNHFFLKTCRLVDFLLKLCVTEFLNSISW